MLFLPCMADNEAIEVVGAERFSNYTGKVYGHDLLLREVNKAFCGFSDPCKSHRYEILLNGDHLSEAEHEIVTGNWGCGAFRGDPEPMACHFSDKKDFLDYRHVTKSITSNGWSVGDLWNTIAEYSSQRSKKKKVGFFNWLLPRLYSDNPMISDP
ncbi:poly(ADP-ribose) glycohydrolase 1-like protein isoform X1 [Tanacetum coccineum]